MSESGNGSHIALDIHPDLDKISQHDSPEAYSLRQEPTFAGKSRTEVAPPITERLAGIPAYQYVPHGRPGRRTVNYDQLYPKDKSGEELSPNARVWSVYVDEADLHDNDMIRGFRDSIDALLAALFSAVVTTFVTQTSQAFQPNYQKATAVLMAELVELQRSGGNQTAVPSPSSSLGSAEYTLADLWVNGMWFTSLALSLSCALISVLVKQWLQAYMSVMSGTVREQALTRQLRFTGLQRWKLPLLIGLLPILLHLSLAIFLAGLVVFTWSLSPTLAFSIIILTAASYTIYITTAVLSALYLDCPYRIDALHLPARYTVYLFRLTRHAIKSLLFRMRRKLPFIKNRTEIPPFPPVFSPLRVEESLTVRGPYLCQPIIADALLWLYTASSDPTVAQISVGTIAGTEPTNMQNPSFLRKLSSNVAFVTAAMESVNVAFSGNAAKSRKFPDRHSMLVRSLEQLDADLDEYTMSILCRFFICALGSGQQSLLTMLSSKWPSLLQGGSSLSPLCVVCAIGKVGALKRIIDLGADPKSPETDGYPFILACTYGNTEVIRHLLELGVNPSGDALPGKAHTPLHYSCMYKWLDAVQVLLKAGADVHKPDLDGLVPLQVAVLYRHEDLVQMLLDHSADCNRIDPRHVSWNNSNAFKSPLKIALEHGYERIAEMLRAKGGREFILDADGQEVG